MDSPAPLQIAVIAIETLIVLSGIVAWIRLPRVEIRRLRWEAPLTDTLMLFWAVFFSVFLGQLLGASLLKLVPADANSKDALQAIILVCTTDGAAIAAWIGIHAYLSSRASGLPYAIEGPFQASTTLRQGGAAFLRALPLVMISGLVWGLLLRELGLPDDQQDIVDIFERTDSTAALAGLGLVAIVLVPIAEELVFRAGLFRVLGAKLGRWPAILISSAVFGAIHMSWLGFAPLFCLGIIFCLAYERSRNIAVPIIAHGLFNLNSILLIVLPVPEFLK